MKHLTIKLFAIILLASCSSNSTEFAEETEYRNYVAALKAKLGKDYLTPSQRGRLLEQTYEESGLGNLHSQAFLSDDLSQNIKELDKFYNDVIVGKYEGHVAQDHLKFKFINLAVTALNLLDPQSPEQADYLVKLTRELMKVDQTVEVRLIYLTLSVCKGRVETNEFNEMVKQGTFKVRHMIERTRETLSRQKTSSPPAPYRELASIIESHEHTLSLLEDLRR